MVSKISSFSNKDFEFYEELGHGAFADVRRAECLNYNIPDRFVAIKRIQKKNYRRVKNEFIIHSRLTHPNIIKLYGKYEDQEFVYLILELCSEGSLEEYLKRKGRLKEAEARKFFKQIVESVRYLHKKLVIHRDIALKNILLSNDNTAKLADFGLSVEVNHANDPRTTCAGTPLYMSPEVVMKGYHTMSRDCWSLGCVLYTLLVGKAPFNGKYTPDVLTNVVMQDLTFPDYMSREAKQLISCLLEKEESKRPGSEDILKFDFFKEQNDLSRNYRHGDSGTGSMGSSALSSSRTSHLFDKTSNSGMDYTNSRSPELRWSSEKDWKSKYLDTISSSGVSCGSKSKTSLISDRESFQESRSRPRVRNVPNMLPDRDYISNSKKVHEVLDSISRIQIGTRKDDHKRSTSRKSHPRHNSSEKENESCKAYSCELSVPGERSKHREGSGHYIDRIVGENKVYGRFTSSPYGSDHVAKSRSSSPLQKSRSSNPESKNKICKDPNCRFVKSKAYSCELSVPGERSKHREGSGHYIDRIVGENKVYGRYTSSPYGSGHVAKSRSSSPLQKSWSSNPESKNKICKDPNCRFVKPLPVDGNRKEYLPSGSHSNACKSENTACLHKHSYNCFEKVASSTSQLVKTTNNPTESCKTTEPLNTKRLSPLRKMLRKPKVVVYISEEGRVFVEHFRNNEIISLIFEISPDGKVISHYKPKKKYKVSDKPLDKRKCLLLNCYSFENFPKEYSKFYGWAKTTVDYERATKYKILVWGEKWKCKMMENGPDPNFNMEFYNGAMVKKTSKKENIISYIDENGIDHLLVSGGKVNKNYENIWKEFSMAREQCEIYEETNKPLEEGGMNPFPATYGNSDEFRRNSTEWKEKSNGISSFSSLSGIKSSTRKDDCKRSASKEKYQNAPSSHCSSEKENESHPALSFPKNDENRTASNYNHVPLKKNNCLTRSIDQIMEKLKRKPEVVKGEIIAEYFDGFQLRCSKDGTDFSFFDPCNRKIKSWDPKLKRRLQQDLLGILVYIGEEDEKRRKT